MKYSVVIFAFALGCAHRSPVERKFASVDLYVSTAVTQQGAFLPSIDGVAVDSHGNVYAGNFLEKGMIAIKRPDGDFQAWLQLPEAETTAANGEIQRKRSIPCSIRIDAHDRMFVADYVHHRIYLINLESKELEIYFQSTDPALMFHQPNDMAIARDGTIFLSDPKWSGKNPEPAGKIWKLSQDLQLTVVRDGLFVPNGIALSQDQTKLFFTDSATAKWVDGPQAKEFVFVHDLTKRGPEGTSLVAEYNGEHLDGLRLDQAGNIFVAVIGSGLVDQLSPRGEVLRRIQLLGKKPTNLAFGGEDGRTMYVTQREGGFVEAFRTEIPGY